MKMRLLQLFLFAAFLATVAEATTALQTFCATLGTRAIYNGTSCYVHHKVGKAYPFQKNSCQDILGYYGHLVFIKNSGVLNIVDNLTRANGISTDGIFVGFVQADNTGARNASWGFANIDGSITPSTYAPWASGYPSATTTNTAAVYQPSSNGMRDTNAIVASAWAYCICEYEEGNYHNVTQLEQLCNATTLVHIFVNGKCYTLHPELKTYLSAKSSCNDFPGINVNGYLAQPHNSSDLNILNTLLWVQSGNVSGPIHIGVEHTNNGWYYSTSTAISFAASYLPWTPSYPNGITTSNSVYYQSGLQQQSGLYYNEPNNITTLPFICEYAMFYPVYKQYTIMNTSAVTDSLFMSINTYTNVSIAKCFRLCRIDPDCASSAYSTVMSTCQLLGVANTTSAANFTNTPDYEIFTFSGYADLKGN